MIERLTIPGIELPKIYIARNREDIGNCRRSGVPYISWRGDMQTLIKLVMLPSLKKMFPHIRWNKVLGITGRQSNHTVVKQEIIEDRRARETREPKRALEDIPDEDGAVPEEEAGTSHGTDSTASSMHREFAGESISGMTEITPLEEAIGDITSQVNIEILQQLGMLPKFVGDITDCIRDNIVNAQLWNEGYNKKLGQCLGNYDMGNAKDNLIVLDVSSSIPFGIAATMLSLIDTLRHQCNADLIVTGMYSYYWSKDEELPGPGELRRMVPRSNEGKMFRDIISKNIAGRHLGTVIGFGDNDSPGSFLSYRDPEKMSDIDMRGFTCERILSYVVPWRSGHPGCAGYIEWARESCPNASFENDWSWCSVVVDGE